MTALRGAYRRVAQSRIWSAVLSPAQRHAWGVRPLRINSLRISRLTFVKLKHTKCANPSERDSPRACSSLNKRSNCFLAHQAPVECLEPPRPHSIKTKRRADRARYRRGDQRPRRADCGRGSDAAVALSGGLLTAIAPRRAMRAPLGTTQWRRLCAIGFS